MLGSNLETLALAWFAMRVKMLGSNLEILALARFAIRVIARFEFGNSCPSLVR